MGTQRITWKKHRLSVYLRITYLVFSWIFFIENMLKYTCILKFFEKVKKFEKKWDFKKLYINAAFDIT